MSYSGGPIPIEVIENQNGVVQRGKNLNGKLMLNDVKEYLNRTTNGYVQGFGENTFAGTQLPYTLNNPDADDLKQTPGFDMSVPDIGGMNAVNFDRDGGVAAVQTRDLTDNQPMTGNESRIVGGSDRMGSGRLNEALADTESLRGTVNVDPEMARRAAFLGAPGSMEGMKAVKAQQNLFSLGTKDYMVNGEDLIEMDYGDMRERLAGRITAEQLKDKYVTDITETLSETPESPDIPATQETQSPTRELIGRLTVPPNEIPANADSPEMREYIRALDAGELTDPFGM